MKNIFDSRVYHEGIIEASRKDIEDCKDVIRKIDMQISELSIEREETLMMMSSLKSNIDESEQQLRRMDVDEYNASKK
jgi:hypothetical protein